MFPVLRESDVPQAQHHCNRITTFSSNAVFRPADSFPRSSRRRDIASERTLMLCAGQYLISNARNLGR